MLEKLATHDVDNVTTLFALVDKCARAAEGRAWHSEPQVEVTKVSDSDVVTQGRGRKKKRNKSHGHEKPWVTVSVAAAVAGGQGERSKRPRPKETAVTRAQGTPRAATEPPTAVRLSNSHDTSASGVSSPSRTTRRPITGQAKGELAEKPRLRKDKTSTTSRPRGA
jgi:hypothetical protein